MSEKFIVTITPPTPNGDLHIGHIAGPFLNADIFTRTQRLKGAQCYLVSYSDDYQSYLKRKAIEENTESAALAKFNSAKIQASLKIADIHVDHWLESYENHHFEDAVRILYELGIEHSLIEAKTSSEPYCENCELWGYEAFARGGCNHCGSSSDPSQCECCAMAPNSLEMTDLKCTRCNQPVIHKSVERMFLKLPTIANALHSYLEKSPMRPKLRSWVNQVFKQGVTDWGVTRPGESGLKLYDKEISRVHTWFMGLAGYFAALNELSVQNELAHDAFELLFDKDTRMVNFLGMDCSYSHVLAYPAQVLLDKRFKFKNIFYTNDFLKLDGLDFSTSRSHAIWVQELIKDACVDSVRFYVALVTPEDQSENFSVEEFFFWRDRIFKKLIPKIITALQPEGMPILIGAPNLSDLEERIVEQWHEGAQHDNFSLKKMASALMKLLEFIDIRLSEGELPRSSLTLFILLSEPVMPTLSQRLQQLLDIHECTVFKALLGLNMVKKAKNFE
ncbi:methionine--tRNA ligase [Serratia rubidaea]|nr:methionine--tRNA ligase [Serratia rubidaea]